MPQKVIVPERLKQGDTVRVIAPARSLSMIPVQQREIANERFKEMGLRLTFGTHVEECDDFRSSSIASRVEDLHAAFKDPTVKAIITVIGGFNSNQLLRYIDWDLISSNPKIFCGYSDITALQNSILRKTGLVTYSGPHYSTFAMRKRIEFTIEHFKKCLFESAPFQLRPSEHWSDDPWYMDQEKRDFISNPGYLVLHEGVAEGRIVGGNLCTLNLLQGTEYMPSLEGTVLFIEDDEAVGAMTDVEVDRNLQSLIHLPDFSGVRALVMGRFQKRSEMTEAKLRKIIGSKKELSGLPIVAGVDFGHTDPYITFPVGGTVRIEANGRDSKIVVAEH
jgi:muramoyltetrapeptide carboxypeptidase